jgi:hypothetical protein
MDKLMNGLIRLILGWFILAVLSPVLIANYIVENV